MPDFDTIAEGAEPVAAYRPLFELGRGGMGTVHLARAVGLGGFERLVVVKRLNRELLDQPEAIRRFLDEARQAALIHHANVVGIHQIGKDAEGHFLVLDYVEGASLEELSDRAALRGEVLPPPIVLRIGLDALSGLSAAHSAEDPSGKPLHLLHRDVSLQNVLVGRDGVARLTDFGIAKSSLASVSTDQRYLVGKLLYSPPEYLARKPVGPELDIYALGVTLWMALAGTEPWPDADEAQLVARICQERVPSLAEFGVRIAPQLDALIAKACDPDASRRFSTAREMIDAVDAVGRDTGWLASHAEVADLVERLLGIDLRRRKEKIAATVVGGEAGAVDPMTHRSVPPPESSREGTTRGLEVPMKRSNTTTVLVVLGVAAALGLALLARSGKQDTEGGSSAGAKEGPPASQANASSSAPPGSAPSESGELVPEPSATETASPPPSSSSSIPSPRRGPARRGPAVEEKPSSAPPRLPAPGEPASGDTIQKANPYRR